MTVTTITHHLTEDNPVRLRLHLAQETPPPDRLDQLRQVAALEQIHTLIAEYGAERVLRWVDSAAAIQLRWTGT